MLNKALSSCHSFNRFNIKSFMVGRKTIAQLKVMTQLETFTRQNIASSLALISLISPCHAEIFFSAKVYGPVANIYSVNTDGKVQKITDNIRWRDLEPSLSENGVLTFMSNRETNLHVDIKKTSESYNIFQLDMFKGTLKNISNTSRNSLSPQTSPDGQWVSYVENDGRNQQLYVSSKHVDAPIRLLKTNKIGSHTWNSDSQSLFIAESQNNRSQITQVNIHNTQKNKPIFYLENHSKTNEKPSIKTPQITHIKLSPDGKQLAYITHPFQKGAERTLHLYNIKKKSHQKISIDGTHVQDSISWSSDSQNVLFSALKDHTFFFDEQARQKKYTGGMHIYLYKLNGKAKQLSSGNHLHRNPIFSPDNQSIAFLFSDQLGDARTLELRTMSLKGENISVVYKKVAKHSTLLWQDISSTRNPHQPNKS